jgi:hypothetical protein
MEKKVIIQSSHEQAFCRRKGGVLAVLDAGRDFLKV